MAAFSTPDPRPDASGGSPAERLRLLRELGSQAVPAWAALESTDDGTSRVVVVERAKRKAFEEDEIADWIRDARRLAALDHPNVVRVRDVLIRSDEVLVVSDFVDGVRWSEFAEPATRPPLETALRVFIDALSGLGALHNLRDAKRQPLKLVHGGLTPDCILVGSEGVARIASASRPRSATARIAGSASYLAPEVLLEDESADARADVYSVGVMLWEALSLRPFLPGLQPSAIVTQLLSGRVPAAIRPEATPWAAPLGDVVKRALSADPAKRFPSAATLAAELRRIGATKLPTTVRVASAIRAAFGTAVQARRQKLERADGRESRESNVSMRASQPADEEIPVAEEFLEDAAPEPSQTAPTLPPPGAPHEPGPEPPEARPAERPAAASPPGPRQAPAAPPRHKPAATPSKSTPEPSARVAIAPAPASALASASALALASALAPTPALAPAPAPAPAPAFALAQKAESAITTAAPLALASLPARAPRARHRAIESTAPRPPRRRRSDRPDHSDLVRRPRPFASARARVRVCARVRVRVRVRPRARVRARAPAPEPALTPASEPALAPASALAPAPPPPALQDPPHSPDPAPPPAPAPPHALPGSPPPVAAPPVPRLAKPKPAPARHGYDPQGI